MLCRGGDPTVTNPPSGQISSLDPVRTFRESTTKKVFISDYTFMPFCSLKGSARYEKQDGRTALYLDGSSGAFAETPSLPIHRTSLTIAVWIKMKSSGAQYAVYGDWSYPWSFRLFIDPSGHLCADARKTVAKNIFGFCTR